MDQIGDPQRFQRPAGRLGHAPDPPVDAQDGARAAPRQLTRLHSRADSRLHQPFGRGGRLRSVAASALAGQLAQQGQRLADDARAQGHAAHT
ncbi:MAG: hypothetical protein V9H69_12075 [Anaerolineae bacterium]